MPTLQNTQKNKEYRNILHALLRKLGREHYDHLLQSNKNNMSKQWSIIKEVINKKRASMISDQFVLNDKVVTDKSVIAESFNNYYVNIGPNLEKSIPDSTIDPLSYVSVQTQQSMFAAPVITKEIENVIKLLKNSGPGWDNVTADVVKGTCD